MDENKLLNELLSRNEKKLVTDIRGGDVLLFGTCPSCGRRISNVEGGNFCQNCGQRLKWNNDPPEETWQDKMLQRFLGRRQGNLG